MISNFFPLVFFPCVLKWKINIPQKSMKQMKVKESTVVTESKCETVFCWLESYKKFWGSRVKETEKKTSPCSFQCTSSGSSWLTAVRISTLRSHKKTWDVSWFIQNVDARGIATAITQSFHEAFVGGATTALILAIASA